MFTRTSVLGCFSRPVPTDFGGKGRDNIKAKTPQITVLQHLRGVRGMYGARSGKTAGNYCCLGCKVGIVFSASLIS